MKVGRKILVVAAFAALAAFVIGGSPATANGIVHPCWDIDKHASIHGVTGEVTDLDLALGESIQIDYSVVVTMRECGLGETPDLSVDVFDTYLGVSGPGLPPGTLAIHLDHSQTFTYSRTITAETCDSFNVENTATVVDGTVLDSDTVNIHVTVHCNQGCTLTQGYWKTHSARGPAPLDDTWNLAPNVYPGAPSGLAENTPFYFSGQTWYQVFQTPSSSGNAYYILARQYMAAVLNILNGASSTSAVNTAITNATTYFNNAANTPASALNLSKSARNTLLGYATTLANYNTGLTGPGHCDEDHF